MAQSKLDAYNELLLRYKKATSIYSANTILMWDSETGHMPPAGAKARADMKSDLKVVAHEILTSPEFGDLIEKAKENSGALNKEQSRNLELIAKDYFIETSLPKELVKQLGHAQENCRIAYSEAKKKSDWSLLEGPMSMQFALIEDKAGFLSERMGCKPYDAMLDSFDMGSSMDKIDPIFEGLKQDLPPLVEEISAIQTPPTDKPVIGVERQREIAREVLTDLGYDPQFFAIGEVLHPFAAGIHPGDVRVNFDINDEDFTDTLTSAVHELGHGKYENCLPSNLFGQPIGEASAMSVHESQSLFYEKHLFLSREYLSRLYKKLIGYGDFTTSDITKDDFIASVRHVKPSFIRTEADEVTYPLHVIIRYEIEKGLFNGDFKVSDLPDVWNEYYQNLLGITPPNDREGVLQDIHWNYGYFGYFPSYTLGAIYAANLKSAMVKDIPSFSDDLKQGDLSKIDQWMENKIHKHGMIYDPYDLITQAIGHEPDSRYLIDHFRQQYLPNS